MHDWSWKLGHVRYTCTKDNAISHKAEKEGKPHGKNPPPKREITTIKQDAYMDGEMKTP